jgi:DNA-binding NtrC family response regulator
MILAPEGDIDATYLPEEICEYHAPEPAGVPLSAYDDPANGDGYVSLREYEDDYIQRVLIATGNNKTHASRILGIHPTSLLRRLKKLVPEG